MALRATPSTISRRPRHRRPKAPSSSSSSSVPSEAALDAATSAPDAISADLPRIPRQQSRQHPPLQRARHHSHRGPHRVLPRTDMRTQRPTSPPAANLFSELEFTTLLRNSHPPPTTPSSPTSSSPTDVQIKHLLEEARAINPETKCPTPRHSNLRRAQAIAERSPPRPSGKRRARAPAAENMTSSVPERLPLLNRRWQATEDPAAGSA